MLTPLLAAELDPANHLIDFGVLGIIVVLFIFGYLIAKPTYDQARRDKERAEAQRDALIKVYEEQVIPVMRETAEVVVPVLNEIRDDIKEMKARLR